MNYGFVLVCWDQMIHRAAFPAKHASPDRDGHRRSPGADRTSRLGSLDAAHRGGPVGSTVQGPRRN